MIKKYENGAWSEISPKAWTASRNLFNKNNADNRYKIYPDQNTGEVVKAISSYIYSLTIPVLPNTTYTISKIASTRRRVAGYNDYPEVGDIAEFVVSDYRTENDREVVTFTTTANTNYILFFYFNSTSAQPTPERLNDLITSVQLEYGSEMTSLIPYGEHAWIDVAAKQYDNGEWKRPIIYGWHVDPSISDSSNAVTYLEEAVGKTPAAMGAESFSYGDWENAFFMPKPCMLRSDGTVAYYLNPNDYTKKADGTASDVANENFDGNAMMEWPLIWYKFEGTETDGEGYFYVSNVKIDNTYHCWCNIDSQNNITPHFYTAIYNGTGTTKLRSISGVVLTPANGSGSTNATQEETMALANNTTNGVEWYTEVWCDRLLINALLVLMGKSLNTQAVFGRGLDTGGQEAKEAYVAGTLNNKGLFWGDTANGTSAVKVFGMENWWGCCRHRTAGCISVDRVLKIKLTYGTADGSTTVGYNQTGNGYISNGTIPSSNNYIRAMAYNQYGYMASNVNGASSSTYYADWFHQNTGTRGLMVGGTAGGGVDSGAFYFYLGSPPGSVYWSIGTTLSCKPLAN